MKKVKLINAQAMHQQNPKSFDVPSWEELDAIKAGDHVKVCVEPERFWVLVTKVDDDKNKVEGKIDNDLVCSDQHGLLCDDVIEFEKSNIYSIYTGK